MQVTIGWAQKEKTTGKHVLLIFKLRALFFWGQAISDDDDPSEDAFLIPCDLEIHKHSLPAFKLDLTSFSSEAFFCFTM